MKRVIVLIGIAVCLIGCDKGAPHTGCFVTAYDEGGWMTGHKLRLRDDKKETIVIEGVMESEYEHYKTHLGESYVGPWDQNDICQ